MQVARSELLFTPSIDVQFQSGHQTTSVQDDASIGDVVNARQSIPALRSVAVRGKDRNPHAKSTAQL